MENEVGGAKKEGIAYEGRKEGRRGKAGVCEFEKGKKEELEGNQEGACEQAAVNQRVKGRDVQIKI